MSAPNAATLRALNQELKGLKDEPLEGFRVKLADDSNLFEWEVAIFGPPGTIYQGGYFKARMRFPQDYPFNPPSLRFDKATSLFHPNVYESGDLCISILHPPVDDPHSGELPCERWNPTQNVRTILLSVVSLLNEPNTSSPANVDASVMYRRWKESNGHDVEFATKIQAQVNASRLVADQDGVIVPTTLEEYVLKPPATSATKSNLEIEAFGLEESDDDDDDDDGDDNNDQSSTATDDSFGGSQGEPEQGQGGGTGPHSNGGSADHPAPESGNEGGGGGGHSSQPSRDKKGGGECMDEEGFSDSEAAAAHADTDDCPTSKKKMKLVHENSSLPQSPK